MNPIHRTIALLGMATPLGEPSESTQTQLLPMAKNFYYQGVEKSQQKDYLGAFEDYNQAIRLNPNFAQAYLNRSIVRILLLRDFANALDDYTQALRISDFNLAQTRTGYGNARADVGDIEGAIREYSNALQCEPDYAEAYLRRGNALAGLGDNERAIKDLQKAADLYQLQENTDQYQYVLEELKKLQQ